MIDKIRRCGQSAVVVFWLLNTFSLIWPPIRKSPEVRTISSQTCSHESVKTHESTALSKPLKPATVTCDFLHFLCNSASHTHMANPGLSCTFNLTNEYGVLELMYGLFNSRSRQVHCPHVLCMVYLSTPTPSALLQKAFKIFSQRGAWDREWT